MSRGQLARNRWNFPAMNDRGGRRRYRRTIIRARRFAAAVSTAAYTYDGGHPPRRRTDRPRPVG